jgi:hypothetical protein
MNIKIVAKVVNLFGIYKTFFEKYSMEVMFFRLFCVISQPI